MRCLIFGGTGILGRALAREQRRRGESVLALSWEQADLEDAAAVAWWVAAFRPEAVINCAAWTRVDDCESDPERAFRVNGRAVANAARAAAAAGAALVQVSTDYVFDGRATAPYEESATPAPLSVYGASKLAGEREALAGHERALVVRTSWLFGEGGPNFVDTILGLLRRGERRLRVVGDQIGGPTHAPALARGILDLLDRRAAGVVHYRGREPVSWADLARAIVEERAPGIEVETITTAEFPRPAARPAYSVLAVERAERLLGRRVEPWRQGLWEHLESERQQRRH